MKSPIAFPEEVITRTISSSFKKEPCQTMDITMAFHADACLDSDNETDQTTSSTITDSGSEDDQSESIGSVSDCDENDLRVSSTVDRDDTVNKGDNSAKTDNAETASSKIRKRRSVSFGPIHVRQYERIVGDHPVTKVGVPLSIGWGYYEDDIYPDGVSIERYECDRIHKGKIRMSSITRKNLLLNVFGLPEKEILQAEKRSKKLRKERERGAAKPESTLKTFGKKLRKGSISLLKGISYAQVGGIGGGSSGFSSSIEHVF